MAVFSRPMLQEGADGALVLVSRRPSCHQSSLLPLESIDRIADWDARSFSRPTSKHQETIDQCWTRGQMRLASVQFVLRMTVECSRRKSDVNHRECCLGLVLLERGCRISEYW